jgi:biotin operon repressor
MSEQMTTIYPESLDEIRQALTSWWDRFHKHSESKLHFSRSSQSENRLVVRSPSESHVRLRLQKDKLSWELSGHRCYLALDRFDVETEVGRGFVLFEFRLREGLLRPLKESLTAAENTKYPLFVTRAVNAVTELVHELPKERLEEATTARSDYLVLLGALATPLVAAKMAAKDPLAAARLRGVERQQSLLKESGGVLSGEQVAKILGISRQAVDKRRRQGHLIGLTQGKRGYAYPAWQFEGGRTLTNLEKVLDGLRSHDPWMQLAFFVNGNDRLNGRSPLELLRAGEQEAVLQAAESYGEQGAA